MEPVKIAVLTSGGDAPGMNAVVRAVIRTALYRGTRPFAIQEGWKGAVEGGDLIKEMTWGDVSSILGRGGTVIGTARSERFREREGIKDAVANFLHHGIDRLVSVGGDGSLAGTDELQSLWPELSAELVAEGRISQEVADAHPKLRVAGVVGSIDNDLVGTDMTVGADSALHRIIDAIDAINSTAESHRRTFVVEVMGRHCGYLALMSAIAGGCDYVFVPERPPAPGWEDDLVAQVREGRHQGRRDSIVIVAEGATDQDGNRITSQLVQQILEEKAGEDARVTILGHVQRGGAPSAYDRWMPTLLGYAAAIDVIEAGPDQPPVIIGTRRNRLVRLDLVESVAATRKVKQYTKDRDFESAINARGSSYRDMITVFDKISVPPTNDTTGGKRVAIMHAGGLAPGMNTAVRAAVRLGIDRGWEMLGVTGGFPGLINGNVSGLSWQTVEAWSALGGAELGTRRKIPTTDEFYALSRAIETHELDGLMIIGGLKAYEAAYAMVDERHRYPAFNIPITCIPATIDNNMPGSELTIGADTALNSNVETLEKIKQSASASRRCFVTETMGRNCGYLALMSAIASGAEQVYLAEKGITLHQLAADTSRMIKAFENGRRLYLVVRNEYASEYYTTDFLSRIFEEEGAGLFDVRQAVLGHMQQGGTPSPFDRILAVRLVAHAVADLEDIFARGGKDATFLGMARGDINTYPIPRLYDYFDPDTRLPRDQWWLNLTDVSYVVSDPAAEPGHDSSSLIDTSI